MRREAEEGYKSEGRAWWRRLLGWCVGGRREESRESEEESERRENMIATLPDELWFKVLDQLEPCHVHAFASTCKHFRQLQLESGRKLETRSKDCFDVSVPLSEEWFYWHWRIVKKKKKEKQQPPLTGAKRKAYHALSK